MQKAAFSIVKYQFDKVKIDLDNYTTGDMNLDFNPKGSYLQEESSYTLTFIVKAFQEDKKLENPFVQIQCVGLFKFENVNSFEEIPDFFYKNSIAILFPYVRAYVSIVTTQANIPGIILPTYNLSGLEGELRQNTIKN
jgi:preprotein translocase subunit SecB